MEDKRILCVGLACLDVINVVADYPKEDTDQRSLDQYSSLGGNAANSSVVMTLLGVSCEYFGTLAEGSIELIKLKEDLDRRGVKYEHCPLIPGCICPNSCVIVNAKTASRTIIHTNKNLPELSLAQFQHNIDLNLYDWIHFEGRNLDNVKQMIAFVRQSRPEITLSVEVEKINRNFEELIPLGDVVFVSKELAQHHGAKTMLEAIDTFKPQLRSGAKLICAWGDQGAAGYDTGKSQLIQADPHPPVQGVVDTLGAGDTFNAAAIGSLKRGKSLEEALNIGCQVAGAKVGQKGFDGLRELFSKCLRNT